MGRLGTVIQAMNSQLGTCFAPFVDGDPHTGEQLQVILDGWSTTIFGDRAAMATARPSDARHVALEDARAAVRAPRHAAIVAHCEHLHRVLAAVA